MVAANLVVRPDGRLLTKATSPREIGGVNVGILGLAYPKTPWTTSSKNIEGLDFQTPVDVARRCIPRMRDEGMRLIVLPTIWASPVTSNLPRRFPALMSSSVATVTIV